MHSRLIIAASTPATEELRPVSRRRFAVIVPAAITSAADIAPFRHHGRRWTAATILETPEEQRPQMGDLPVAAK